jgi:thiamine biosynthesis lipoprotein ApbE
VLQTLDSVDSASRLRIGMGTIVAISAEADTAQRALSGIESAFEVIAQVERLMHPTRPGSDLLAIRQGTLGLPLAVHPWTWEVLAQARRLNHRSKGAFDPWLAARARATGSSNSRMALLPPAMFAAQPGLPNTVATTTAAIAGRSEPARSASAPRAPRSPMR